MRLVRGSAVGAPDTADAFAEWVQPHLAAMARLAARLAHLWVSLAVAGEAWGPPGLGRSFPIPQKTFWWSADWLPDAEPQPAISVTGTRLDGPGSFRGDPGTNASAEFGTAMLVGVDIPSGGCWRLTGRYQDAELSYVVWVQGD